jgi:hypothetical protein
MGNGTMAGIGRGSATDGYRNCQNIRCSRDGLVGPHLLDLPQILQQPSSQLLGETMNRMALFFVEGLRGPDVPQPEEPTRQPEVPSKEPGGPEFPSPPPGFPPFPTPGNPDPDVPPSLS